jgi:uncharacterized membrane protein YgdD (TMEM256/DUF423 family)
MQRFLLLACAINGFLAVLLGAFGAHGLQTRLANLPDAARRLGWWQTASTYHLAHALALGLLACCWAQAPNGWMRFAGIAMLVGILLFSGSLYLMTLTGMTRLGAVTPLGGLGFLLGWVALGVAIWRARVEQL